MLKRILRERRVFVLLALTTALLAFSAVSAFGASGKTVKVKDDYFTPKTLTVSRARR